MPSERRVEWKYVQYGTFIVQVSGEPLMRQTKPPPTVWTSKPAPRSAASPDEVAELQRTEEPTTTHTPEHDAASAVVAGTGQTTVEQATRIASSAAPRRVRITCGAPPKRGRP